jgi:type IV pilus assembly protein PilB
MAKKRLGEVLQERGHISPEALSKALEEQHRTVSLLGEVLLHGGTVDKSHLVGALEEVTRVKYVDCLSVRIDPQVLKLIPRAVAKRNSALPLSLEGQKLVTAMAEPQNLQTLDELRFVTGKVIVPRLGFRSEILSALEQAYDGATGPGEKTTVANAARSPSANHQEVEFIQSGTRNGSQAKLKEIQNELQTAPTAAVRFVSEAIAGAVAKDASDIHIEPQVQGTVVRIRVDGVLRELMHIPREQQTEVISRVKILADMDIAERRKPQDGRIVVRVGGKNIDLRISTLPTQHGEKVVIRLLDPSAPRLEFPDLGMNAGTCELLKRVLHRPQGMLLVTGPTGSGKTTTLYAALHQLRSPDVNIITVEDPVEYMLEGINQVPVNLKSGLTFSKCLRSILRQDPNIIMVGEIRDGETAEIALKAAQTGHLVLSTVHTNDSIAAITRLVDLQVPAYLISSSVTAILSQRLVRKLCACSKEVAATPEYEARLLDVGTEDGGGRMHVPVGCPACDHTGYHGRIGIFELLVPDGEIQTAIRSSGRFDEIRELVRSRGMKTMQEDALEKARAGLTTLEELLRVIPFDQSSVVHCGHCSRVLAESFLFCPFCGAKRSATNKQNPVPISQGEKAV